MKNVDKFYLSTSVAPYNQLITRFDCHAAVCLWIQEATFKGWISLEQNIIDTAESSPCLAQYSDISINLLQTVEKGNS